MDVHVLPAVNASLNATSGVLLLIAYALIRARRIEPHRRVMIAAFVVSSLFLVCYVVYHARVGSVPFTPLDWVAHYGRDYPAFVAAKATWDPRRVLAPGQGIFGPPR